MSAYAALAVAGLGTCVVCLIVSLAALERTVRMLTRAVAELTRRDRLTLFERQLEDLEHAIAITQEHLEP